jgi:hypothetical protein
MGRHPPAPKETDNEQQLPDNRAKRQPAAGQAPAGPGGRVTGAARQHHDAHGRCPGDRRDQPGPRHAGGPREADPRPGAPGARRGHSAARLDLRQALRPGPRQTRRAHPPGDDGRPPVLPLARQNPGAAERAPARSHPERELDPAGAGGAGRRARGAAAPDPRRHRARPDPCRAGTDRLAHPRVGRRRRAARPQAHHPRVAH